MSLSQEEKRELFEEFKKELMETPKVYVEVCREGVELPEYANIGDAGMDIRAAEDISILPGQTKVIKTGIKVAIPQGYELQVRPRSGLSLKTPLRIANTPGTIDSGYRDEVGIIVNNTSEKMYRPLDTNAHENCPHTHRMAESEHYNKFTIDETGNKSGIYRIRFGDRIAQIVLVKFETIEFEIIDDVKKLGLNRGSGFGSTGTK